ncbi:MAG: YebC/PmpR family DNA-binding transcriptional regulator [Chloroflexi bacterium]|nr:MAG: YebC/PmpR family DNA-binding transcriptional regulator [Chloroflexota bacterium]HDN80177.1 YebC/PmpR family DNA-binding transcriptional regulator [Chloroflexota bacterium]
MSGHSKWANIKRRKAAQDAKRGQLFTKLGREIEIAAREGPDPETNFKLRLVIEKAKRANMPKENIERAIRRGAGLEKGRALEEFNLEGYGPQGVAMLVHILTDNRNRAVADVRRVFTRHGGNLGESGCVSWLFEPRGYITLSVDDQDPEELAMIAIDAGADDVQVSDDMVEVYTTVEDFQWVKEALEKRGLKIEAAQISMVPKSLVSLDEKGTFQNMNLIEALEELDDVTEVYSNLDISDEMMNKFEAERGR